MVRLSKHRGRLVGAGAAFEDQAIFDADVHSYRLGELLNVFVTVRFGEINARRPQEYVAARKPMREWLTYHDAPFHWVYTHEHPPGGVFHSHWLFHVPLTLQEAFAAKLPDWFDVDADAIDIRPRYGERLNALRYMCKGTDWGTAMKFGICRRDGSDWKGKQGRIPFKRAGHSQSLGRAARLARGLQERSGRHAIASMGVKGVRNSHD